MAERLSRDEYLARCLWRNLAFQEFMVRLWQEFPPVLEKARAALFWIRREAVR